MCVCRSTIHQLLVHHLLILTPWRRLHWGDTGFETFHTAVSLYPITVVSGLMHLQLITYSHSHKHHTYGYGATPPTRVKSGPPAVFVPCGGRQGSLVVPSARAISSHAWSHSKSLSQHGYLGKVPGVNHRTTPLCNRTMQVFCLSDDPSRMLSWSSLRYGNPFPLHPIALQTHHVCRAPIGPFPEDVEEFGIKSQDSSQRFHQLLMGIVSIRLAGFFRGVHTELWAV